jgi:hypothetical protein
MVPKAACGQVTRVGNYHSQVPVRQAAMSIRNNTGLYVYMSAVFDVVVAEDDFQRTVVRSACSIVIGALSDGGELWSIFVREL